MKRLLAAASAALLLLPQQVVGAALPEETPTTQLLILFSDGVDASARRDLHSAAGAQVTGRIPQVNLDRVEASAVAAELYRAAPGVAAVEPAGHLYLTARRKDPLLNRQWGLMRVEGQKTWRAQRKAKSVKVAVVDTGVDAGHPDLAGRVEEGFDYLARDEDPFDDHGHGTHIAGVISANINNNKGVAGIALNSTIIPMKSCERGGTCPLFETYLGIVDAVQRGAQIINLSLGSDAPCSTIDQAIFDYVHGQGVLVVAAAGNSGADGNPSINPANCNYTLGVAATDPANKRAPFSGYGDWVDIAAPGVEIWSTLPPILTIATPTIGYGPMSGTSMATPFVVAVAAVVKARHPDWGPDEIAERLTKTARDLGKKGRDPQFGAGLVNARRAAR